MRTDAQDRAEAIAQVIEKAEVYSLPAIAVQGERQAERAMVMGTVTQAGDVLVTVIAPGMVNSPKASTVPVQVGHNAYTVAAAVRAVLATDTDINGFFDIGGTGINVELTAKADAANEPLMNIAISNGTSEGIGDEPVSLTISEGTAGELSKVEAIVDRHKRATRWVAGLEVVVGNLKVLPMTPNGRIYTVKRGGLLGTAEPFNASYFPETIYDGSAVLEEAGYWIDNVYDIEGAVVAALEAKLAISSRFVKTEGVDMSAICHNIREMLTYYQRPLLG